jgi:two-component system response regulator FixJ
MSESTAPPTKAATVFIVDDDASFLKSVARLLRAAGYSVQTFDSAKSFLERPDQETPGCVVADLQMPGLNGLELQAALGRTANPLPVIFMTGQGDIPTTVHALRQGAEDFLTKLAPKENLFAAVERALLRNTSEERQRRRRLELRNAFNELSARELEVLGHVVRGRMNKQIAADLGINLRTVKLHRTNLTRKLKVQSVAELTRLVEEAGLFRSTGLRPEASQEQQSSRTES